MLEHHDRRRGYAPQNKFSPVYRNFNQAVNWKETTDRLNSIRKVGDAIIVLIAYFITSSLSL